MNEPIEIDGGTVFPQMKERSGLFVATLFSDAGPGGYFFFCWDAMKDWMIDEADAGRQPIKETFKIRCGPNLASGRNQIVAKFLDSDCEWLASVDSDQTFEPAVFVSMMNTAIDNDLKFLAGISTQVAGADAGRNGGVCLNVYVKDESGYFAPLQVMPPPHQIMRVDAVGGACTLIHRSVFEAIGTNWYHHFTRPDGDQYGEDISFCIRCEEHDIPIHIHTDCVFPHAKIQTIDPRDILPTYQEDGQVPETINDEFANLTERELALIAKGVKGGSDDDVATDLPPLPDGVAEDAKMFPLEYVQELRQEAASNRVKVKELEEQYAPLAPLAHVFDGYDDEGREAWAALIQLNAQNPVAAREALAEAMGISEYDAGEMLASDITEEFDPDDLATKGDLLQFQQSIEEQQAAAYEQSVNEQIISAAEDLGYEPGTESMLALLGRASINGGDLQAAHESILSDIAKMEEQIRESLLEERTKDVQDSVTLPPTEAGGAPASQAEVPKGFDQSKASALERIKRELFS